MIQIVAGFNIEICRPYRKEGSQLFLLNIKAKLFCLNATGLNLVVFEKLSHTCRNALRHQARVPEQKCFDKILSYARCLAESVRYKDIVIDLKPIEFVAKVLPSPPLLPALDGDGEQRPFYSADFQWPFKWSILSLSEKDESKLESLRDRITTKAVKYGMIALSKENCVQCQSIRIDSPEQLGCHFAQLASNHQLRLAIVLIDEGMYY
ncbi:hypothetical protein BLA29_009219, partial [Euroglyphus maynei]